MNKEIKKTKSGYLSWIIATLLFGAMALLFMQNSEDMSLVVFWQPIMIAKNLLITFCSLLGFVLGLIVVLPGRWKLKRANRKLLKAQKEIDKKAKAFLSTSE